MLPRQSRQRVQVKPIVSNDKANAFAAFGADGERLNDEGMKGRIRRGHRDQLKGAHPLDGSSRAHRRDG